MGNKIIKDDVVKEVNASLENKIKVKGYLIRSEHLQFLKSNKRWKKLGIRETYIREAILNFGDHVSIKELRKTNHSILNHYPELSQISPLRQVIISKSWRRKNKVETLINHL